MTQQAKTTTNAPNNRIEHGDALTPHDAERSSGLPFYIGVLGYLAALPLSAIMLSTLGVL